MSDVTKEFSKLGIMKESVKGEYEVPASDSDFIETTEDGATVEGTREKKDRNVSSGDRIKRNFRLSKKDVSASVPVEFKADDVEGDIPKYTELLESAGFGVDQMTARVVSGSSHTTTTIFIADTSEFSVNQIVLVKESEKSVNEDIVSPIVSIDPNVSITLLVAAGSAFTDTVEVAKCTNLQLDKTVDETLSVTKIYEGDAAEMHAIGCRVSQIAMSNFVTGEYPSLAFDLVGLNFEEVLNASAFSPSYDGGQPPLILNAGVYKDGSALCLNEVGLTIANNVSIKTCTANANGNESSRGTGKYVVSGTLNPFKSSDTLDFELDEAEFSLFFYAYNPTSNDGEKSEVIAVHIPKAKLVSKVDADQDGIITESLAWEAVPSSEADSIRIALI